MVKFGEKKNIKGDIIWCKQKTNKQTAKKKKRFSIWTFRQSYKTISFHIA